MELLCYVAEPHAAFASAGGKRRSEYFASGSGEQLWRSLSAVLMDAAPVLATQKRSDRPPEDPGGPCRAWIESDVEGVSTRKMNKEPHKDGG